LKSDLYTFLAEKREKSKALKVKTVQSISCDNSAGWMNVQKKLKNSVVKVIVNIFPFNWFEPYKAPEIGRGVGSGFFINSDGYIITNFHVVNQACSVQIEISSFGAERLDAEVVGVCPDKDIAMLRLTEKSKEKLRAVFGEISFLKLGNSDLVNSGQSVMAMGYPLDDSHMKGTLGVISGNERVRFLNRSCIQTTAPINPGSSGGPSVNVDGEVIGVNFAGVVTAQNVGYMIPVNNIKGAIRDLSKIKLLRNPILGCFFSPSNEDMASFLGNPMPGGYYIVKVFKNTILEKSGVVDGDMIYKINDFSIDQFGMASVPWNDDKVSMMDIIDRLEIGDTVAMVIYRKGTRRDIEFILEPRFLQPVRFIYPDFETVDYETIAGLVVMELAQNHIPLLVDNSNYLVTYGYPEHQYEPALLISHIQQTSLASKLRILAPGMIIDKINGKIVKTLKDFRDAAGESRYSGFFTVTTKENWFVVFSVENILKDEDRLSQMYSFKKSKLLSAIC
jgi:serine protease Do